MRIYHGVYSILFCLVLGVFTGTSVKATDTLLIDLITIPYNINTIASDSAGTIWVSGAKGIQYYDFKKKTFVTTDASYKSKIIAENGEIIRFNPTRGKRFFPYPWTAFDEWLSYLPSGHKRISAARDKFGHYWVSTGSQMFIFSIEDRFEQILPGYSTRGIYQDGGDLYVNSYSRGILKNGQPLFEAPPFSEGEIKKIGESLYFAWGGLMRYEPLTQACDYLEFELSIGPLRAPPPISVQSLEQIQDTIWVGTNFGLGYIENDSVVMITNYPDIQDLTEFEDKVFIVGSNLGTTHKHPIPRHHLPEPDCENCRGMYVRQNNQLRKLDIPDLNYWQVLEADENYYFASDSGVVVWDGANVTAVITEYDGLTDNRTCTMAMDKDGFLWVSTFSGLNRINLSTGKITRYMENIEFNYRSVYQNDSLIYMGSMHGVYIFNPKNFLGDDIEPAPYWSLQQILILFGLGLVLVFSIILYFLNQHHRQKSKLRDAELKATEKKLFLLQIEQVVLSIDIPITVSNLAHVLEMSERTLYRSFQAYDLTPGVYLKKLKLKKAKYLLKDNNCPSHIKKVAHKVGYSEQYLSRLLKSSL